MVPIDDDILDLIDHITAIRSHGRPMPHPRYRRPAQFLFTHHGRRLSQRAVRDELDRAACTAGLDRVTPHQLRHTYSTALVNAGVSLQALMALLGHASAEMSLRYGRLFDTTVRAEYERALDLAKKQARTPTTGRISLPLADITGGADWKNTPLLKSRMAGGFCLRAPDRHHTLQHRVATPRNTPCRSPAGISDYLAACWSSQVPTSVTLRLMTPRWSAPGMVPVVACGACLA
jgi:Phage integrase family